MKKKYTLKQYINPDFHLHLHDDEIQMISKFNYRSKMYTNELLKSTNCKSTTAAFSKVRKSPPPFLQLPHPLTLPANRSSQIFLIDINATVKLRSIINNIYVKQQQNIPFSIFKFTLKYMLSNVYINKINARQCL